MDKQERWMLRIPSNSEGEQFFKEMKKYLNKDTYKVSKMYTGPRPKGTSPYTTRKENATSVRLYVDSKSANNTNGYPLSVWSDIMKENSRLKLRLDTVYAELTKVRALVDWRKEWEL